MHWYILVKWVPSFVEIKSNIKYLRFQKTERTHTRFREWSSKSCNLIIWPINLSHGFTLYLFHTCIYHWTSGETSRSQDASTHSQDTSRSQNASTHSQDTSRRQDASTHSQDNSRSQDASTHSQDTSRSQDALTNSDDAAQLLRNLFQRKGTSPVYSKKHRDEKGCFGPKHPGFLSWRRYCQHQFSLKNDQFFVVCCNTPYRSAAGLISHLYRKH